MTSAIVVGSGPNGLAAAAVLARAGVSVTVLEAADSIGGGTRTTEGLVPGLLHDHCSAVHPMAAGSALYRDLGLERHGLEWRYPAVDCAHPLDDGSSAALFTSVQKTAEGLGQDGRRWRALFEHSVAAYDRLEAEILGPVLKAPRHPLVLARFGAPTTLPATVLARWFRTEQARSLWTGVAAHAFQPLNRPLSSAIGLGILTAGHHNGWAVAAGGSRSIANAMAAVVLEHGGRIETGVRVRSAADLGPADAVLYDLAPGAVADILGNRLPARVRRGLRRFAHGPAAYKVDFAVDGEVPWTADAPRSAGTVHLGGSAREVARNEHDVARGLMPERPFVLVGQQYLADPQRSVGSINPIYAYAHVPRGYAGDATDAVMRQIERFAPGFRERIVGMSTTTVADFSAGNPNFVDGDILTGAKTVSQVVLGPRRTLRPYDTGVPGHYICSAATPPGPGAHGMCGANAARRALRFLATT